MRVVYPSIQFAIQVADCDGTDLTGRDWLKTGDPRRRVIRIRFPPGFVPGPPGSRPNVRTPFLVEQTSIGRPI